VANSAFCSLDTVGSSPKNTAASIQLITDLHLAMWYRMNAAISPLLHMPSWCAQGQLYVSFLLLQIYDPAANLSFILLVSSQQLTWFWCATAYRWGLALWRNNSVKVGDIFLLLWCCSLTTLGILHGQALTGDRWKSVQSLSTVDPCCGPQFLRQILSDLTL
jgi:hypothetical protein